MVDDMDTYLKDFKQKMQTRGNEDTMTLDEAAWHLSSIANYDFGNVDPNFKNFHYDTLYYNINVDNGRVSISDLNALYTTASADIATTFQNLDLENKHIHFIGATIDDDGTVCMSILSTYDWITHQWYFPDALTLSTTLSPYFAYNYSCDYAMFTDTLTSILNLLTAYYGGVNNGSFYFIYTDYIDFNYYDYPDPYGPHIGNSHVNYYRIFRDSSLPIFIQNDFFYYFDSYAGLGVNNLPNKRVIINWSISKKTFNTGNIIYYYHEPRMNYGQVVWHDYPPVD